MRSSIAVGAVGVLAAGALAVLAVRDPGYAARSVDLTQSDVWVTNQQELLVGRINKQIDELNSAVRTNAPFDVLQDGESVLVLDGSKHELRPLDEVSVTLGGRIPIPRNAAVALDGGVLAVADEKSGALWAGSPQDMLSLDPTSTAPTVKTGSDVAVTVAQNGTVFAVAPGSDSLWTVRPQAAGTDASAAGDSGSTPAVSTSIVAAPSTSGKAASPVTRGTLAGGALSADESGSASPISITAVGAVPIVLDRTAGRVQLPDRTVAIPDAASAILQQPGPQADFVLVATSAALLRISMIDGTVRTLVEGQSGAPAAPVLLDGCVHAAWSSSPARYALACGNTAASTREVPGHTGSARMVFRVNRHTIVLNDVTTGSTWTAGNDLTLINNWDEVQPLSDTGDDAQNNSGTEGNSTQQTASHTNCAAGKVDPPAPQPDKFGVRAGRSTVLRVLDNDGASDCSMAVITGVDGWTNPARGTAVVVDGGRALQVTVPDGASGELPALTYHVSDGRSHDAKADVAVTVVPADQHDAPVKLHDSSVPVETLGTVSYNVLGNYLSPDGDDLFLASASIDNGDDVSFEPDGTITFTDTGVGGAVKKTVNFVVSDGSNQVPGKLIVDVRPEGTAEPLASPVYSRAVVGRADSVDVLASVTSPSAEPTRLTKVSALDKDDKAAAAMVGVIDQSAGTVRITGAKAGTYYFSYQVSSGTKAADGLLRVDVISPSSDAKPPVAMTDIVYLPTGGVATLDPTANDTDPMAAGLAVVDVQADPSLTVTAENMQVVTVSAQSVLDPEGASIRYTVSNTYDTAEGLIRVLPVPAHDPVPPIAHDVDVTVRAGDAVTVPIAAHAFDPNGDMIKLTGLGTDQMPANSGVLFHTDSAIRYLAPAAAPSKPLQFSYTVTNTAGAAATAAVTIHVDDTPRTTNQAPAQPAPALARVFVDSTVAIALPLDGIDPDGDWVTLQDIARDPGFGQATVSGLASVDYTAGDVPGYDSFEYTAADPYGGTVVGQVSVLVVAKPTTLRAPTAPNLATTARPGKTVAVNVVGQVAAANAGQQIELAKPGFEAQDGWNVSEDKAGNNLVIQTPATPSVGSIKYTVINQAGLTASGILTVTVSDTDALKPPTAKDVVVAQTTVKPGQKTVTVAVPDDKLANPSGTVAELKLTLDPQSAGAGIASGHSVKVTLTAGRQVLAYRVTNAEKSSATAFIVVPGVEAKAPPTVQPEPVQPTKTTSVPEPLHLSVFGKTLSVKAGETLNIDITDHVKATDGSKLQIPNGAKPTVTKGGDIGRVDATHVRYRAPKNGDGTVYVSIPVSDGKRTAQPISLPVTVIPVVIPAPTVQSISLSVEAGTTKHQDIKKLVTAGNAEQQRLLTYRVSGGGNGITGSLDGTVLTVTAALAARGKTAVFTLTATDGQGKSGSNPITVTATGSQAPRLKVSNAAVTDGRPGAASTVNVLKSVTYNPFEGAPTLVSATKQSGEGTVTAKGTTVSITPSAVGTVVAAFTLRDATGDPDRDVSATITVTVQDKPTAPGTPTVVSMSSQTVQLKWSESKPNGSPITKYVVSDAASKFSQSCTTSPCTLKKLTNGIQYRFSVAAVNAIGTSESSKPSAPVTPDTAPNTPAAPTLTWLDGQQALQVDWKDPGSDGTPVSSYDLQISPADGKGTTQVVVNAATSYTWQKLTYGQPYTFSVRAHNASKTPSSWSSASKPETPSTKPGTPTGVKVTFGPDNYNAGGNTLTVSWKAPENDGGAALTSYLVKYTSSAGSDTITVSDPSQTSATIQGVADGVQYSVTVTAVNRSGPGKASDASTATPFSPPGAVSGLTATATGTDGQVALTWKAAVAHGRTIDHYQLSVNGVVAPPITTTSFTASGLSNGQDYTFEVAACYSSADASFNTCGASDKASASPFGPVGTPSVTFADRSDTQVRFNWSIPPDNGRSPITTEISIDGGGWSANNSGTIVVGNGCGQGHSIKVRAHDSEGHYGGTADTSGSSNACPSPSVNVYRSSYTYSGTLNYVWIDVAHYPANANVSCGSDYSGYNQYPYKFSTNGSGSGGLHPTTSDHQYWYAGTGVDVHVTCTAGSTSVTFHFTT